MSLRKFRSPSLLDKHEALLQAEEELDKVEESEAKEATIIKKSSQKN